MILKISRAKNHGAQGHVLAMVLVVVTICAIALMSYLTLVNSQNRAVARSQGWNSTVPVMEAGVEDALAHLNANTATNLECEGWVRIGNYYRMERSVGDGYYVATITVTNIMFPVIESRGFCRMPLLVQQNRSPLFMASITYSSPREGYTGRGVHISTRQNGSLTKAMLSKGRMNIGGTVRVDSYNSCDPNYSTGGMYDPTKATDSGDMATNGQFVKEVNVGGDVKIKGHISTGPGGTIGIAGNEVSIGSSAWVNAQQPGIEPGWARDDMNANLPDAPLPPPGGLTPGGGYDGPTYYDYILSAGTYSLPELQLSGQRKMLVTGDVILKIDGDVQMTDASAIMIAPSGSLQMYVGGSTASLGGNGVINQTYNPWRFTYYGAKPNTRVTLGGGAELYGVIYAPYAELTLGGDTVIYGGTVSKTLKATGGFTLHYDKCLSKGGQGRYIVTSWDEMFPQDVARIP